MREYLFVLFCLLVGHVWAAPVMSESRPLGVVSELSQRIASHSLVSNGQEPRLPFALPSAQDIDTIKKVAQILVLLGEQVIPTILGDSSPHALCDSGSAASGGPVGADEIPNDPIDE